MKRALTILLFCWCVNAHAQTPLSVVEGEGYKIPVYDFKRLEPILNRANDTVYVYNFWATWCVPCVEEMPAFLTFDSAMRAQPVRVLLVSMDMKSALKTKLIPFLKQRNVTAAVAVLSDPDADSWIDKVNPDWNGTIPATLFVYKGRKLFHEGQLTYDELHTAVENVRKQP